MNGALSNSILFLFATVLFGTSTQADDSANNQVLKLQAEAALAQEALSLERSCGAPIAVSIDWAGFPANAFDFSVAGYCESLLDALDRHCVGGEAKRSWITNNISALRCAYSADNSNVATIEVDGDAVTGRLNFDMSNLTEGFYKALLKSL